MSSNSLFSLPAGPSELCFDKNEFMKTTFSVDDFLHEHRNAASLEQMRDDLGTYLKILRLAMIELINHDYGDFVNLSNKLVGLHEHINNIRSSLENLQSSIYDMKLLLENIMNEIDQCLSEKKKLIQYKKNIRSLIKVQASTKKLIDLLDDHHNSLNDNNNSKQQQIDSRNVILERASLELMQSQFHVKFCNEYLNDDQKQNVERLNRNFLDKMRVHFLNILNSMDSSTTMKNSNLNNNQNNNANNLEQCLRIYASLDKISIAEEVFQEIVDEYMKTRITEQYLQNNCKDGLSEIYTEILNFVPIYMKDILLLTHYTDKIKGFRFLINSVWKDVVLKLETRLLSIFAPGNPENFYANFKCTKDFLKKFETILDNEKSIMEFRQNEYTRKFLNHWNLPVYFQIRFQEIAGPLENQFFNEEEKFSRTIELNDSQIVSLFNLVWNRIQMCWSDGVYIEDIFPKLLKLTIQIVSRLCKCIENYLENVKSNNDGQITRNVNNVTQNNSNSSLIESIIKIYVEMYNLIEKLPNLRDIILNKMPKEIHEYQHLIDLCFESLYKKLESLQIEIENILIQMISNECERQIRQVGDIPRLYRKTNRDVPNRSSQYIQNTLNTIDNFIKKFDHIKSSSSASMNRINKILLQIFTITTEKYFVAIQDVLTSVQKTEESLKRLKSLRDKSTTTMNSRNSPERSTISDDDKIRIQLQLDVIYWNDNILQKGFTKNDIHHLSEMINLIEDVQKIKNNA